MMSVKSGTQTWSTAQQTSSLKAPAASSTAAVAGGNADEQPQNIGEIANKIADPNWIDPSKKRKVGSNELDKDAFLKLMLAQMKHQDPTNPLKSHEMAAQLAQFTSLEQLFNINESLGEMKKTQDPRTNFQALEFIGKAVSGDSSKVTRAKGDKEHDFNFNLPAAASEMKVKVRNAAGDFVRTFDLKNVKAGPQKITWNGITENGDEARPGEYTFMVEAKSSNGAKIVPKTDFEGRITGVNFTVTGPVLMIGNQTVRLSDVRKIVDPSLNSGAEKGQPGAADLSKQNEKVQTQKQIQSKNASAKSDDLASNLDSVVMSGGLADRLKKDTKSGG
jgi:flagellar basal-body rod modification protein FlgD